MHFNVVLRFCYSLPKQMSSVAELKYQLNTVFSLDGKACCDFVRVYTVCIDLLVIYLKYFHLTCINTILAEVSSRCVKLFRVIMLFTFKIIFTLDKFFVVFFFFFFWAIL